MESILFIVFICICSSYAVDKVFYVDQVNYGIYHADIEHGKPLTEQEYQRARFAYIYRPGVMTYDFESNMVMWGQRSPHKIGGDILDGVPNTVDIVPGVKPFVIAFNEYERRIYWFGNVSRIIASARLDGKNKIRVHVNDKHIFGLCIDGLNGMLYFSEGDRITQMNVDGTGKKNLVEEDLVNVTAFTRNAQDGNLFWINHDRTIEMYDIVKHVRNIVATITIAIGYVEQIVIYDDIFYWVDIERGGIGYLYLMDQARTGFSETLSVSGEEQSLAGILHMKVFIDLNVDICSSAPCEVGLDCVSTTYDYECVASNNTGNSTDRGVTVVPHHIHKNPCEAHDEHYPCDEIRGVCSNVNGTAVCGCGDEYVLSDDDVTCLDHENCSHCDNGECVNTDGIYSFVCNLGFKADANGHCLDVNECENITCDKEYGMCINTVGGFYCVCEEGFFTGGNGYTCQVNCNENTCQNEGKCLNNRCYCPDDFEGRLCEIVDLESDDDDLDYSEESSLCENYDDHDPWWKLSTKKIIVIVVVIILVIILVIIIIVICCRCKKQGDNKAV